MLWSKQRTRGSRGVIAMVTGAALFFVVGLSIIMAELGLAALQRFEMHDSAEALAMAEGYQVLSQPSPGFGTRVSTSDVLADNARTGTYEDPAMKNWAIPTYAGPTASPADAGGKQFDMRSIPPAGYMTGVGSALSVGGSARVVVNQYQVSNFQPIPARIVLVVDYSRSMRLPYPGGGLAAKTIMQNAITTVLNYGPLTGRVDWGVVLFADTVGPGPQGPIGPPGVYNQANVDAQKAQITTMVQGQTFGNGTDLAGAVNEATGLLTAAPYTYGDINYGKNVMIIITDGEPDVDPGASASTPYQQLVDAATANARTAVQNAWNQGIQTITILIKRETTLGAADDQAFMASIAGDGSPGGPSGPVNHNAGVADFEGGLGMFLLQINPSNHCLSTTSILPPPNSWMPAPNQNDMIFGFWVPANVDTTKETLVPRYANNRNMDPLPNPSSGAWPTDTPAFYFDQPTGKVELNVTICMDYLNNQAKQPTFRARYGLPRISWTGSM